jgi:hypothetical protein
MIDPNAPPPAIDPREGARQFVRSAVKDGQFNRDRAAGSALGDRERGPVIEKYIRELPLEYREIMKAYYERLAK